MDLARWAATGIDPAKLLAGHTWVLDHNGLRHLTFTCSLFKGGAHSAGTATGWNVCSNCAAYSSNYILYGLTYLDDIDTNFQTNCADPSGKDFIKTYSLYRKAERIRDGAEREKKSHFVSDCAQLLATEILAVYRAGAGMFFDRQQLTTQTSGKINSPTATFLVPAATFGYFTIQDTYFGDDNKRALGTWWRDDIPTQDYLFHGPRNLAEQVLEKAKAFTGFCTITNFSFDEDPSILETAVTLYNDDSETFHSFRNCIQAARLTHTSSPSN